MKTKAEIKKTHDAMARLFIRICRRSDSVYGGRRPATGEKNYQAAIRLIHRAGFKYKAPAP